jgi:HEAT repeat protein
MSLLLKTSFVLFTVAPLLSQQTVSPPAETQSNPQVKEQEAPQQTPPSAPQNPPKAESSPSTTPRPLKDQAWEVLRIGAAADKPADRAAAIHAIGLIPNDPQARKMAEAAIKDEAAEVRTAAAAALGEMRARQSIPQLQAATEDEDPAAALAAAHALLLLNNDAGYEVYYEVLTGQRKTGKGLLAQAAEYKDPKKLAEVGFHEALGFIPFGGLGWSALKMVKKGDASPARAAAATVLAKDRDPKTTKALADAVGDKNWIIRTAALEALAVRGDPSVLGTVELYLSDEEGEVKYTAAATALRLIAIKRSKTTAKPKRD